MTALAAARVIAQLGRGEPLRGRRLLFTSALLFLPAVVAILLAAVGRWGAGIFDQLLEIDLAFLVPFLPVTLLGGAVADELDRGTAGYLFVRPAPREALLFGRLLAVLPTLLGSAAIALIVGFVALYARFLGDLPGALPHLAASMVAVLGGLLFYSVLALGGGAAFRKRPVAALLVVFVLDAALAHAPVVLRVLAPSHHLRVLAGLPDGGTIALPFVVPLWGSAIYLIVLLALAVQFGIARIRAIEMTGESA